MLFSGTTVANALTAADGVVAARASFAGASAVAFSTSPDPRAPADLCEAVETVGFGAALAHNPPRAPVGAAGAAAPAVRSAVRYAPFRLRSSVWLLYVLTPSTPR